MKLTLPRLDVATVRFCSEHRFSSLLFGACLTIISPSTAVPQTSAEAMSAVEEWVVAQLKVGEVADLAKQFPDKQKDQRKLSARFLEAYYAGRCQVSTRTVMVCGLLERSLTTQSISQTRKSRARFDGIKVQRDVQLPRAEFDGRVDFESADISGNFGVAGAKFQSKEPVFLLL